MWDPDRVAQVISNLVSNALTHGLPGTAVRVVVDGRERDAVVVCVNNRAECPPAADLAELFDPFRRGRTERWRAASEGLGLGLYITHEVVRAHGGRIEVTCSEEEGFTILVRLPREPAGEAGAEVHS